MMSLLTAVCVAAASALLVLCLRYPDTFVGVAPRPDLPGPRGWPLVGNLFQILPHQRDMVAYLHRLGATYGPLYTFTLPVWGRNIVVNHPVWLAHVRKHDTKVYGKGEAALSMFREFPGEHTPFATEGQAWTASRKIMRPVFSVATLNTHMADAMDEMVTLTKSLLIAASAAGTPVDWNNLSGRVAFVIFCKTALSMTPDVLSSDLSCLEKPDEIQQALFTLNQISAGRLFNPIWNITEKWDGTRARFARAQATLHAFVDKIVRDRVAGAACAPQHDFLATLLADPAARADPALMRDMLVVLLVAGRDNTQNAMAWALCELARQPRWLARMREEAAAQLPGGQRLRLEDVHRFPVHLAVFHETLRMWPGVPKNARVALCDDALPALPELGYAAVPVRKGDYVLWNDWTMMRDPAVWGDTAGTFDPARHLDAHGAFVRPDAPRFHAFGAGPRLCPGAQLAAYEFVALWAGLLPAVDVVPVPGQSPRMADALTSSMAGAFMVRVSARADGAGARADSPEGRGGV